MCSRLFKGMLLLAALAMAMAVGAVLGGSTVYLLTRTDDGRSAVEISAPALEPWARRLPALPRRAPVWGVLVLSVSADSPASSAGLREGDLIVALNDEPVTDPDTLVEMIAERAPGDEVELTIYRLASGDRRVMEVTLGEHPSENGMAYLGVWLDGAFFLEE